MALPAGAGGRACRVPPLEVNGEARTDLSSGKA